MSPAKPKKPAAKSREWHARIRRRDAAVIASGRLSPEEVNQRNSFIPNASQWKPIDRGDVLRALYGNDAR